METGQYLNAGVIFKIAVTAYERTKQAPSDRAGGQDDALVCILFAAATLEALITELAVMAKADADHFRNPRLRALADVLYEIERARGRPQLKFQMARTVLTGQGYDKGSPPFQDFTTLLSLRDSLVHLKPEDKKTRENILARLRPLKVCMEEEPNVTQSWLSHVGTRAVARWACNAVADMADSIKESFTGVAGAQLTAFHLATGFARVV